MILEGLHEKEIFAGKHPFRLEVNSSPDFYYPLHWHNAIELVYIGEGICKVIINGIEYTLGEKDILLVPSGEIHDIQSNGSGKRHFIQFDLSVLEGINGMVDVHPFLAQALKISPQYGNDLHSTFQKLLIDIIEEYETKKPAYILSLNARILDILVLLSRSLTLRDDLGNVRKTKKVFGLEKINSAFKYIESNYMNDISLSDVSKAVGFSEYHFSRLFKEIAEKNFHSYLSEFRVKKAERLLSKEGLSIAQIAHEVGFNSFATFNRLFKKANGCTPSSYRKTISTHA